MNTPGTTWSTGYAIPKAQAGEVLKTLEGLGATFVHHDDRVEVTVDGATVTLRYLEDVVGERGSWAQSAPDYAALGPGYAGLGPMAVQAVLDRQLGRVTIDRQPVQPIQFMIGDQSGQPLNRAQRRAMAKRERKSKARAGRR